MTQDSLSALLDGECSPAELDRLLDEMERAPEIKARWSRLCAVREAAEGTRIPAATCICSGVMAQLGEQAAANPRVVPLRAAPRLWKPLAALAAAAGVAAVAVMVGLPGTAPERGVGAAGFSAGVIANPVSLPVPAVSRSRDLRAVAYTPDEEAQQLDNYLVAHSNSLAGQGMGGTLRYTRLATHSAQPQKAVAEAKR